MSVEVAPASLDPAAQAEPGMVANSTTTKNNEVEQLNSEATASLATRSSYYYAHTTRGSDTVKFEPPRRIEAGGAAAEPGAAAAAAAAAGTVAEAAGASKWNTGSYHWEETDLRASFAKLLAERAALVHLDGGKVDAKCSRVECEGDIFSNLRKGKVIMAYDLKLRAYFAATFTRGADSDPVHFKGSFRVENVCEDSPVKEWRIRDMSCEVVDPPTDGVTPAIMVAEPGTARPGKRVMSATEMDRTIRQQRIVQKHVDKKLTKKVLEAVESALLAQRAVEEQRQLGKRN